MAKTSVIARSLKKVKFKTRKRNRCQICGRPRGFIKLFGVCRICFRILAHRGELPGIRKASW